MARVSANTLTERFIAVCQIGLSAGEDAIDEGSATGSAVRFAGDGSVDKDFIDEDSVDEDFIDEDFIDEDSIDDGAVDDGAVRSVDDESIGGGLVGGGLVGAASERVSKWSPIGLPVC